MICGISKLGFDLGNPEMPFTAEDEGLVFAEHRVEAWQELGSAGSQAPHVMLSLKCELPPTPNQNS